VGVDKHAAIRAGRGLSAGFLKESAHERLNCGSKVCSLSARLTLRFGHCGRRLGHSILQNRRPSFEGRRAAFAWEGADALPRGSRGTHPALRSGELDKAGDIPQVHCISHHRVFALRPNGALYVCKESSRFGDSVSPRTDVRSQRPVPLDGLTVSQPRTTTQRVDSKGSILASAIRRELRAFRPQYFTALEHASRAASLELRFVRRAQDLGASPY